VVSGDNDEVRGLRGAVCNLPPLTTHHSLFTTHYFDCLTYSRWLVLNGGKSLRCL
jgi:hypothetical protein